MSASSSKTGNYRLTKIAVMTIGHLLASLVVFSLFVLFFMTERAFEVLQMGISNPQMSGDIGYRLLILFGLAACFWAFLFILYSWVRQSIKQQKRYALQKSTGTIVTETLIVLPVFLTLTFGLAQMGLNSIAGLLTTLGTYEASRTLAVYGPEVGEGRMNGVSGSEARDTARVAAAAVIAPAVPTNLVAGCNPNSGTLEDMREGLVSAGNANLNLQTTFTPNFAEAFDDSGFARRGIRKLVLAYCATTVESTTMAAESQFDTTVTYVHPNVMPWVGFAFVSGDNGKNNPWVTPHVSAVTRTYTNTTQIAPNPEMP